MEKCFWVAPNASCRKQLLLSRWPLCDYCLWSLRVCPEWQGRIFQFISKVTHQNWICSTTTLSHAVSLHKELELDHTIVSLQPAVFGCLFCEVCSSWFLRQNTVLWCKGKAEKRCFRHCCCFYNWVMRFRCARSMPLFPQGIQPKSNKI